MIIHKESKSLLLKVRPEPLAAIRQIFPDHSKLIDYEGHNIALPHTLKVVKILRNMGIKAPSPIRYYYDWPRPARFQTVFNHQYATADFLTLHNRCFVLNTMGTAKSASCLWAVDYLMRQKIVKRCIIVAPLSTLEMVWLNEIFDVCMHRSALVLHANADKRKELLAREVDFYIINHDGLKILGKEIAARKDINLMIIDEVAAYRNAETDRYKTLVKTVSDKMLWGLSGTPCPNAPTDAWALARLVDPSRVPAYFTQFKRKTMNQISQYKWVPKPGSNIEAFNALQPAIRFKKSDCLDLPSMTFESRQCTLSPEQEKAYKQMKNHLVAEAATQQISAVNAADKIGKLRQILCGAVKNTDSGDYVILPHAPRLKVLLEAIEEAEAKVLIIVPFKGILQALRDEVMEYHTKNGDGKYCEVINGDVSIGERNRIFQAFRDDPNLNELICHPKVMAHGLNLTQADMLIFYAPIYSNEESEQVMERLARPGQTRKMTCIRISSGALETAIYNMVADKQSSQESILNLYKKELQL
ncbi:MAG TPA: DEAD/DEAH box helicase [Gammaproteobacteria bacterium]|nr:DEAD/DEAH box helicase [Gammaproteobacteria bacterium]